MSNNTGILKVHLLTLERSAETLERVVYNALVEMDYIVTRDVPSFEARIWRKLERLDELQEEIDATIAKLKEAGEWDGTNHAWNLYQYNAPGARRDVLKGIGVGGWPAKQPAAVRTKRPDRIAAHWQRVAGHMRNQDGTITAKECAQLLTLGYPQSQNLMKRWAGEGRLKPSHKVGKTVVYCAA